MFVEAAQSRVELDPVSSSGLPTKISRSSMCDQFSRVRRPVIPGANAEHSGRS